METLSVSETSLNFYQNIWRYNPEDGDLYTALWESLKSYTTVASTVVYFSNVK
jgi:hypothetical protein